MKFEDILDSVGSFGLYQKLLCFILIPFSTGLVGFTYYVQLFILSAPKFYCNNKNSNSGNLSSSQHLSTVIQDEYACYDLTNDELEELSTNNNTSSYQLQPTQKCLTGWQYEYVSIFPTITSQNDWICEESWRPYIIVSCFWVGNMIGSWLLGFLSDKFGRRPIVAVSFFIYGLAGIISAFAVNYFYAFLFLRMLVGSCHHTVSHLAFVLVVEYCGVSSRVIPLLTIMMTYTIASILTPLLAIVIWDWKILLLVTAVPNVAIIFFFRLLPESPSWMMATNKLKPAVIQMQTIAKMNKKHVEIESLHQNIESLINSKDNEESTTEEMNKDSTSLISILKFPILRRNVIVVLLIWMISCLCYYGHCQNTSNIGENIFRSFIWGAAIEIPAWSVPFLIEKLGRKPMLTVSYFLSGVSGGFSALLPKDLTTAIFVFALLGRLFITSAYYISLQYCPEIFPTVIRGRGVAMSETFGGIAIFVSPIIVYLSEYKSELPLLIFSSLALLGGFITIILPETKGKALPQTMLQAEHFSKDSDNLPTSIWAKRRNQYEVSDQK